MKGEDAHPLYRFITNEKMHPKTGGDVRWNFQKFLVGADGKVLARFEPREDPLGEKVLAKLEDALKSVPEEKRPADSVKPKKAEGKDKKKAEKEKTAGGKKD